MAIANCDAIAVGFMIIAAIFYLIAADLFLLDGNL